MQYGGSRILAKCAENRRVELSREIVCAMVFREEIATLAEVELSEHNGLRDLVQNLQSARKTTKALDIAFKEGSESNEWTALGTYFGLLTRTDKLSEPDSEQADDESDGSENSY